MQTNYDHIIEQKAGHVFDIMAQRVSEEELGRIRAAFEFARDAHSTQKRKTGEPYILHPIAVANIAAEELMLETDAVIAAFLHDVVEDTKFTTDDIRESFGVDVEFLVRVVTKQKKEKYVESKQIDNYRQMLDSVQYDIRALLVKLSDRLHNMRTLSRTSGSGSAASMNMPRSKTSSTATARRRAIVCRSSPMRYAPRSNRPAYLSRSASPTGAHTAYGARCTNTAMISTISNTDISLR